MYHEKNAMYEYWSKAGSPLRKKAHGQERYRKMYCYVPKILWIIKTTTECVLFLCGWFFPEWFPALRTKNTEINYLLKSAKTLTALGIHHTLFSPSGTSFLVGNKTYETNDLIFSTVLVYKAISILQHGVNRNITDWKSKLFPFRTQRHLNVHIRRHANFMDAVTTRPAPWN